MGYMQDMKRNFSVWGVLGVGFSLTKSWFGISTALMTGINSGGPVLIIYGIILIALISMCAGISLSELASGQMLEASTSGRMNWRRRSIQTLHPI
jgi:choline transport protein